MKEILILALLAATLGAVAMADGGAPMPACPPNIHTPYCGIGK